MPVRISAAHEALFNTQQTQLTMNIKAFAIRFEFFAGGSAAEAAADVANGTPSATSAAPFIRRPRFVPRPAAAEADVDIIASMFQGVVAVRLQGPCVQKLPLEI